MTPTQRDSAAAAARQGLRALQLAERILDSARRREKPSLDVAGVDLGTLVTTAVEQAQAAAKQRGVTVSAVLPPRAVEVRADGDLLLRLLDNLIANAVRASPKGAEVEVAAWRASPKSVSLAVKNAGAGIAPAELPKLLAGLGPGRGLRIAREIAERHGGELWAESTAGSGTRFFVELPLSPPSTRPRVLLVSDDARWLREITRTLKVACEVRVAGIAAARLGKHRTDFVLVDPARKQARRLDALRDEALDAQVPVIEVPSELAAARLARTLAQMAPS